MYLKTAVTSVRLGHVTPKFQVVLVGDNLKIYCGSSTQAVWSKDGSKIQHLGRGNQLALHNVQESDSGYYKCKGSITGGGIFVDRAKVLVAGI